MGQAKAQASVGRLADRRLSPAQTRAEARSPRETHSRRGARSGSGSHASQKRGSSAVPKAASASFSRPGCHVEGVRYHCPRTKHDSRAGAIVNQLDQQYNICPNQVKFSCSPRATPTPQKTCAPASHCTFFSRRRAWPLDSVALLPTSRAPIAQLVEQLTLNQ